MSTTSLLERLQMECDRISEQIQRYDLQGKDTTLLIKTYDTLIQQRSLLLQQYQLYQTQQQQQQQQQEEEQQLPIHRDFEHFWNMLCHPQTRIDPETRMMVFPDACFLLGSIQYGQHFYVRQVYDDLFPLLCADMNYKRGSLITGNPGIGKSLYAVYLFYILIHRPFVRWESIVYENKNLGGLIHIRFQPHDNSFRIQSYAQRNNSLLNIMRTTGNIYIFDASGPDSHPILCNSYTFVLASPNYKSYKYWLKETHCRRYMTTWTLSEIMHVWKCCHQSSISQELAHSRFNILGGIPRYVFNPHSAFVDSIIGRAASSENVEKVLRCGGQFEMLESDISHAMLCYSVDETFSYVTIHFASKEMKARVYQSLSRYDKSSFIHFMKETRGVPSFQSLRGDLFESFVHDRFRHGILHAKYRHVAKVMLTTAPKHKQQIRSATETILMQQHDAVTIPPLNIEADLERCAQTTNTLFVPNISNFGTVDSLWKNGSILYGFQCTVSDTHSVNIEHLISYQHKLGCTEVVLVMIVPPEQFSIFSLPFSRNETGHITHQVNVFVMEVDVNSV